MTRILITGATGFVGRHCVRALADFEVVATVRRAGPEIPGVEHIVVGDLAEKPQWSAAMSGVEIVVHLAALAHADTAFQHRNHDLYERVNVTATISLAEAAAGAGVRHFIFASTIGVHGQSTDGRGPLREADPFRPQSIYAQSKVAAERGLTEIAARTGLPCTILRPPLIHGEGAPGNLATLSRALRAGVPLPLASVVNRRAFLGIANLASFVRHRIESGADGVQPFLIADNEQVSTPEFIAWLAAASGLTPRLWPFPPPALAAMLRLLGRGSISESLMSSLEVDPARSRSTGWSPPHTLAEGLRLAATASRG